MPETYAKTILHKRTKKLGVEVPATMAPTGTAALKLVLVATLLRPIHMLVVEPIVLLLSVYISFNFATLFDFFASFPYVFGRQYGFDRSEVGLTFLAIGLGSVIGTGAFLLIDRLTYPKLIALYGSHPGAVVVEHRLYAAMVGSFFIPIGLFWFGWSADKHIHWVNPVIAAIPFALGNIMVFVGAPLFMHRRTLTYL